MNNEDHLVKLNITYITPNPKQPRTEFEPVALQELADSIKEHGIIQPLIVEANTDPATAHYPYVLIAGERRLRASQLAGLAEVPCIIRDAIVNDQQRLELALIENVQRADLSVADEARAYQQLHDKYKLTDEQIGLRVGKARETVTATRNLAKLPAGVIELIGDGAGQLPKRVVRQFLPLAQAVEAPDLIKLADRIAALDPNEGIDPDDVIFQALEDNAWDIPRKGEGWDLAWPGKPIEFTPADGAAPFQVIACKGCVSLVKIKAGYRNGEFCTNGACFEAKQTLFTEKELARVSKKFNIPLATDNEEVHTLAIDYRTSQTVREWLEQPPAHLRLISGSSADGKRYGYHHKQMLGSPVVALASTVSDPFKADANKTYAREQAAANGQPESEADRKKRIAAEEREARAKREERGTVRKARADVAWLALHAAETVAPQITASGSTLEFMAWLTVDETNGSGQWPAIHKAINERTNALAQGKAPGAKKDALKEREKLLKEAIVLQLLYHVVPEHSNDWEQDWEQVLTTVEETLTGQPEENEWEHLGLKLPNGWNKPPVHKTESNCWHCGRFTPNEQMTQVDRADGWGVVQAGDDLKDMYCPDCGEEIAAKVQADAIRRKVIKSPIGPNQLIGKSKPAPKPAKPKAKAKTSSRGK